MSTSKHVVIIGNGISGITCARHLRKLDDQVRITVISGESEYFFSRTALMYIYMGHMKFEHTQPYENWFWEKNRIELKHAWVKSVSFASQSIHFESGESLNYDQLVLATGSKPNKFGWPGQDLKGVQGLYSKQDLELMEQTTKSGVTHAVIVGGGLIGIEMAEMLAYRKISVTFLVRESGFWRNILPKEESEIVGRHIREHHFALKLETELEEIIGDKSEKVKAVRTKSGEEIPCQFVGLTAGVSPNVDFLKNTELELGRGVKVDAYFRTNIENVFSIGDCAEFKEPPATDRKTIEQVWYTGRIHGEILAHNLIKEPVPYRPGVWFNSAKFLDIEYQTYGQVPADWDSNQMKNFYWEHPNGKVSFRMLMREDESILGINVMGLRMRHEFFDQAIRERWLGEQVMKKLEKANFDPEFFAPHYKVIKQKFALDFGKNIPKTKLSWVQQLVGARI